MSGIVYRCKKKKNKVKKKIEKNKNQEKRKGKKAELEINKDAQKRWSMSNKGGHIPSNGG